MSAVTTTFESVKAVVLSAHKCTTRGESVNFYNNWAENYEQVLNKWNVKDSIS